MNARAWNGSGDFERNSATLALEKDRDLFATAAAALGATITIEQAALRFLGFIQPQDGSPATTRDGVLWTVELAEFALNTLELEK